VIETNAAPMLPSAAEEVAREAALRFARLQRLWGPWGLAWWEALLRCADAAASAALERD
jgi:CRISPR-associated endonuclease/helicase Cas3